MTPTTLQSAPAPSVSPWLTLEDAARRACVSRRTLARWIAGGTLAVYRPGRRALVRADELDEAIRRTRETHR